MIVDSESLRRSSNAIEALLEEAPRRRDQARAHGVGARDRHRSRAPTCAEAGAAAARRCAARCATRATRTRPAASARRARIPFAMWEDQRIVARPRYRDLISALRFVARQEIIFGLHVHVGIDDADKAIHVANGMRVHVPILLALSANSPVLAGGRAPGLASTRMPIFRAFPRVGIPPVLRRLGRLRARGSTSWSTRA